MTPRPILRATLTLALPLLGALGLWDCATSGRGDGTSLGDDAGLRPSPDPVCARTQDCQNNRVCQPAPGDPVSRCRVPTGRCTPEQVSVDCYPDARCAEERVGAGVCTFRPPVRAVFPTSRSVALEVPNRSSDLPVGAGLLLQWSPLRGVSGAVSVAVIMDAIPTFDTATGRIRNHQNVRWIWSSADPGGPVMEGAVPLRYGRAGIDRNGVPGAVFSGDSLPAGTYYWFVFSTVRGEVVASSVAQTFRVGQPVPDLRSCATGSDCFETAADALLFDCIASTCRRRCASDADCDLGRCALDATPPANGRRGAYCQSAPSPTGDAGAARDD
ncbi:MAG: hypothetical protein U0325_32480 [Polyangiales bacterium]